MSAEKRPAEDDPGSSQMLVKRQNVRSSDGALARLNASSSALVQSVSMFDIVSTLSSNSSAGTEDERIAGAGYGVVGTLRGDLCGKV